MGQIEITRASTVEGAIYAYGIYIDDVRVAQVRDGETKLLDVPDGEHTVECRSFPPFGSRTLQIDVGEAMTRLYCKPGNTKSRLYADDRILLWVGDANHVTQEAELPARRYQPGFFWGPLIPLLLGFGVFTVKAAMAGQIDASVWITIALATTFVSVVVFFGWRDKRRKL